MIKLISILFTFLFSLNCMAKDNLLTNYSNLAEEKYKTLEIS